MADVIPFCVALRSRTRDAAAGGQAELLDRLLCGDAGRDDYIALLSQHFFLYEALESAAELVRRDPVVAPFLSRTLTRVPAISADLDFLIGTHWREEIRPLPATRALIERIRTVATRWPNGFIAHHYTRYLGDLAGGQLISSLLQRRFGFETNGVGFFLFAEIADPGAFKQTYRQQLDEAPWDEAERERVIDEVLLAARLNRALSAEITMAPPRASTA